VLAWSVRREVEQGLWQSGYGFGYTSDGQVSVIERVAGRTVRLLALTANAAVIQGSNWNVLRVVASGTSVRAA
jgi:hypothetical protein